MGMAAILDGPWLYYKPTNEHKGSDEKDKFTKNKHQWKVIDCG